MTLFRLLADQLDFFEAYKSLTKGLPQLKLKFTGYMHSISRVPPAFFQHVVQLRLDPLPLKSSTAEEAEQLKRLDNAMEFLYNLQVLDLSQITLPPSIGRLKALQLREISLAKVVASVEAMEALSLLIEGSPSLESVEVLTLNTKDSKRIFEAVLRNRSINSFRFSKSKVTMGDSEMAALSALIRETKSLRRLDMAQVHLSIDQICQFLDALTLSSVLHFVTLKQPNHVVTTALESNKEPQDIQHCFLELVKTNRILQVFHFWFDVHMSPELEEAFYANPYIRAISTRNGEEYLNLDKKISDLREQEMAFDILKTGRVFASSRTVCGHVIPNELVDFILRQYSMDSDLHDDIWRLIRRAVMNRGTIGKILSEKKFNAHELLYLCSLCSRIE